MQVTKQEFLVEEECLTIGESHPRVSRKTTTRYDSTVSTTADYHTTRDYTTVYTTDNPTTITGANTAPNCNILMH
jgi:hypothetical protein